MKAQHGFVADAVLVLRMALGVAGLVAGWFLWQQFTGWIKAPVEAERDRAIEQRDAEAAGRKSAEEARENLNKRLVERDAREGRIDRKLGEVDEKLKKLAARDAALADWLRAPLPPGLIGLSDDSNQVRGAGVSNRSSLDSNGAGTATGRDSGKPDERGPADRAKPTAGRAPEVQSTSGVSEYLGSVWRWLKGDK